MPILSEHAVASEALPPIHKVSNMKAGEIIRRRVVVRSDAFAEIVIWRVPQPVRGSAHFFKYRLAYIVGNVCVMRYDNEAGKGDHQHWARWKCRMPSWMWIVCSRASTGT